MKRICLFMLVFWATTIFAQEKQSLQEDECYQYAMVDFGGIGARKYAIYIQEGGGDDSQHKLTDEESSYKEQAKLFGDEYI
jgi:hypothetical protein